VVNNAWSHPFAAKVASAASAIAGFFGERYRRLLQASDFCACCFDTPSRTG
jgi:hypothetical protein